MGADHLDVEPPYSRQPETLAAAARYLVRSGNADLLCRTCKRRTQGDGVCRRAECAGAR